MKYATRTRHIHPEEIMADYLERALEHLNEADAAAERGAPSEYVHSRATLAIAHFEAARATTADPGTPVPSDEHIAKVASETIARELRKAGL